jgi:AcrR family transcriptional regulator
MALAGKTRKDVLQEFRTSELLDAARHVFALRGYHAATIDQIAAHAGVAKGTVYLYFDSKRELFLAALRQGVLALHAEVAHQLRAAPTPQAQLQAFINARFHYFSRHPDLFRIYYTEFPQLATPTASSEFHDLYEQQAKLLESVLADGIRSGHLRPCPVPSTARLVYDLIRSALAQHILHEAADNPHPEAAVFQFIWKGISPS